MSVKLPGPLFCLFVLFLFFFFFYVFSCYIFSFGFVFSKKSKATYLLLFLSFFFWMTSGQQLRGAFRTTVAGEVSNGGGGATGALCTGYTLVIIKPSLNIYNI